nr:MAG TPA: hypothetical protein [Caudoviricetes sp.]
MCRFLTRCTKQVLRPLFWIPQTSGSGLLDLILQTFTQ